MAEAITNDEVTQAAMADEANQSVNLSDSQAAISDIAKGIRDKYAMTNTDYLSQPSPKYGGDAVLAINKATGEALITNRSDLPLDENFDVKMRIQKPVAEVSKPAYSEFGQGQPATIQPTAKVDPLDTEPARRVQIEAIASQTIKNKYNGFDRVAAKDPDKIDKYVNDRFEKEGEKLFKKLFGNSWRYRDQENMPKEMKTQWLAESGKARARIEKELDEFTKMVEGEEKAFIGHLEKVRQEKVSSENKDVTTERAERKLQATNAMNLRKEFNALPEIKEYNITQPKIKSINALYNESLKSKNFVAVDQALITLFNKLTDPSSVVRESEYARTAQNIPLYNQIVGKVEKVMKGGAGLTSEERDQLRYVAALMNKGYEEIKQKRLQEYKQYGRQAGLPEDFLIDSNKPLVPSKSEFMAAARKANPSASSDELSKFYDNKYGEK